MAIGEDLVVDHWIRSQIAKIHQTPGLSEKLKKSFESIDTKNQGLVELADFYMVLYKNIPGLSVEDVHKFSRVAEKDVEQRVKYYEFLAFLDSNAELDGETSSKASESTKNITQYLVKYMNDRKVKPHQLLYKIAEDKSLPEKRVAVEEFAAFLTEKLLKGNFPKSLVESVVNMIDIDRDGYIGEHDLLIYLERHRYFGSDTKTVFEKSTRSKSLGQLIDVYPKEPLSEDRVLLMLRELHIAMEKKKLTYADVIRVLDPNKMGTINLTDFHAGLDKIVKFSMPSKEGLFAYLDNLKIGLLNYESILRFLKRKPSDTTRKVFLEDSFDWQQEIIKKIQRWYRDSGLSLKEAYRLVDMDFDGEINQRDLERFLIEIVKVAKEEVQPLRMERLMKLMDVFKGGALHISEFKIVVEGRSSAEPSATSTLNSTGSCEPDNFDWRLHAKQQISLALRQKYANVKESFEEITKQQTKMTFVQFKNWIDSGLILRGFNLTDKLIQTLFAGLDPHKKGYLTAVDWENAFGGYSIGNQIKGELQECLCSSFISVFEAFNYFRDQEANSKEITKFGLKTGLDLLLPKRFSQIDHGKIWESLAGDKNTVNLEQFSKFFGVNGYRGPRNVKGRPSSLSRSADLASRGGFSGLKSFSLTQSRVQSRVISRKESEGSSLKLLNIPAEKLCASLAVDKDEEVSNLEFIKGIRKLNLGLKQREIDSLLIGCGEKMDGKIKLSDIRKAFKSEEIDIKILQRSKERLKRMKAQMYEFMISPKDAFYQFNENRNGKLTFQQLSKLMNELSACAREEAPAFIILKDAFDFIDSKKDGLIDLNEWMQAFELIEREPAQSIIHAQTSRNFHLRPVRSTPNSRNATPTNSSSRKDLTMFSPSIIKPEKIQKAPSSVANFESSREYEEVLRCIARNRKVLRNEFADLAKKGQQITIDVIKYCIGRVLKSSGLQLKEESWPVILQFAKKDGVIDYKLLLESFKERANLINSHPVAN